MTDKMKNISRSALYRESGPSLEDLYIAGGYTYDAEKKVWRAPKPATSRTSITVKPEKPVSGDIWVDLTTSSQYIYFEDPTSSGWMQVGGSASVS